MRKNKKERKRIKRERIKNKRLVKKYRFLKPYNVWTGKIWKGYKYETTWADDLPKGWIKAFGILMFDEINEALKKTNGTIYIEQVKEKWGRATIYCQAPREVRDIIEDYSTLSENICVRCGKPDVPMIDTGWMSPVCKECFEHNQRTNKWAPSGKYEDYIVSKDPNMASERKWRQFGVGDNGWVDMSKDISDKANKIRAKYRKDHKC